MEEVSGYIGERDGVRVVVMKELYCGASDHDMMKTAIKLLQEGN